MWNIYEIVRIIFDSDVNKSVIWAASFSAIFSVYCLFRIKRNNNEFIIENQNWENSVKLHLFPREVGWVAALKTLDPSSILLTVDGGLLKRADSKIGSRINERSIYYFFIGKKIRQKIGDFPRDSWILSILVVQVMLVLVAISPLQNALTTDWDPNAIKFVLVGLQVIPIVAVAKSWWRGYESSNWRREVSELISDYDSALAPGVQILRIE